MHPKIKIISKMFGIALAVGFALYLLITGVLINKGGNSDRSYISIPPLTLVCGYTDSLTYSTYQNADPLWEENNKFGLYIYAEDKDFFELAQKLVNSNGGSWGYVLIPYNIKDRDYERWERVFNQLQAKKLIPIVQLWDVDLDNYKEQTREGARFLSRFVWPIKYRYVVVYNEPNDSKFWYGKVDPEKYAEVLKFTIETFKGENSAYYLMNAGFNTTAPSNGVHMDAFEYMKQMNVFQPGIFGMLDGWSSHSYPQPNFSGNPKNVGRWSIKAYDTELLFLKEVLGVKKDLPVFITETGWAHAEGESYDASFVSVDTVSEYYRRAFKDVWQNDDRVRAVTPFTIWYEEPFDHFAWVNRDKVPYKQYEVIKDMKKIKGKPPILSQKNLVINICK